MTDLFQEKAKNWDSNGRSLQLSSGIGDCIIKNVRLRSDMSILDFGAGTGLIASRLAAHVQKITAVDISESMLQKLQSKPELQGKVDVICQDITLKPLNQQFDLIVSAMAMHHVEDTDNMIKQFAAHLNPGGQVALADLDTEDGTFHAKGTSGVFHDGFDRRQFQSLLEKHGFASVRFDTALTYQSEQKSYPIFLALATKS